MKFTHEKNGSLTLRLSGHEALYLHGLASELRAHVENPDFTKRIAQRLFPRYSDDAKINDELRQMLYDDQRKQKLDRVVAFASALEEIPPAGGKISLPPAELERWMALLTDLRLMYAGAIGIEDDNWGRGMDPRKPPSREVAAYLHLSEIQSLLVDHALRGM
jgi:hypothetical protein